MNTDAISTESSGKVILAVPVTHSDWMLRPGTPWGPEGVRYMLDQCKASGWTRVYWRLFDGGRHTYGTSLAEPVGEWDDDNYYNPANLADGPLTYWWGDPQTHDEIVQGLARLDYAGFDTLAEAINYGRDIGLEVHAWLTINEDDHGWGAQSRFTKANPQSRWRKRDGRAYYSQQSFAFPEVQEYKLALIRELLTNYEIDGLFLDWMRTGDVRDDPQNDADGVADFGYEAPLVESFKAEYGVDPRTLSNGDERWVAWRARPQTEFMRSVRRLMRALKPALPLSVMGQHPWGYRGEGHKIDGNLRGLLLDTTTWANEGLIDEIAAAGYYRDGGDAKQAYQWLRSEMPESVKVWLFGWVPGTPAEFDKELALAVELGTPQILFWEGDYIDACENKEALQQHMLAAVTNSMICK